MKMDREQTYERRRKAWWERGGELDTSPNQGEIYMSYGVYGGSGDQQTR